MRISYKCRDCEYWPSSCVNEGKARRGFSQICKYFKKKEESTEKNRKCKWIPVSERLPEPYTFVNVTCHSLIDDREDWVVETLYLPIPKEFNKHGYSDWGNIPMLNWGEAEVIAWVERIIPEPYKAESEET